MYSQRAKHTCMQTHKCPNAYAASSVRRIFHRNFRYLHKFSTRFYKSCSFLVILATNTESNREVNNQLSPRYHHNGLFRLDEHLYTIIPTETHASPLSLTQTDCLLCKHQKFVLRWKVSPDVFLQATVFYSHTHTQTHTHRTLQSQLPAEY